MPPKIMKEIDGAPVYTHSTEAAIDRTVRSFDRGTTAGRLIHQLYNKPRKESTLDLELLKRFAALRSRGADILRVPVEKETREKPTPKSRAYVEYPKLKRAQSLACIRRPNCGGRRPLKVILQKEKMQEDSPTEKKDLEFQEKKKVFCITEQDKELFQRYMQFEGAPPPLPEHRFRTFDEFENQRALGVDRVRVKDKINTTTCSSSKQLDERRELVHLFTVITNEIKERQSLLSSLGEIDSVPSTKLKEEIQERVAELRKIDGWIRELDTQLDDERHV